MLSPPTPQFNINIPSPVSCLAFSTSTSLLAGSQDGTVRQYDLPSTRVVKAIKSLGSEVSCIVRARKQDGTGDLWIASGRRAFLFYDPLPKMIMTSQESAAALEIGEDEEDVLNELSASDKAKYLAFSSDAGGVGVVDLSNQQIHRMKTRHDSICGSVKFIPDRPNELVSGGYDSALLHFDLNQGTILSRHDITAPPPTSGGMSLSPPFILSMAISSASLIAVGTANGLLWLGGGGEKPSGTQNTNKKKRSRKWEGLKEEDSISFTVADGPVVAVAFLDATTVLTCSLLGSLLAHKLSKTSEGKLQAEKAWSLHASSVTKVNTMVVESGWLAVGGISKDDKGAIEVFKLSEDLVPPKDS